MYRYLRSLKDAGLLVSISNSVLTLGPRVVEMDFLIRKSDPLVNFGKVHIHQLARTYPSTAILARWLEITYYVLLQNPVQQTHILVTLGGDQWF